MLLYLRNLLQLLLSPSHGWEDIADEEASVDETLYGCFYPLIGFASLTAFVQGAYEIHFDLGQVLQRALVCFVALMASYYIGAALTEQFGVHFTLHGKLPVVRAKLLALYTVSLLGIIQIIQNLVPVDFSVIHFLPLFTAIVLWGAQQFLDIDPKRQGGYIVFAIGVLIVPWFLIWGLLTILL